MNFLRSYRIIKILFLISLLSCSKDNQQQDVPIPYVPINIRININDPKYLDLNNVGGWVYLDSEGSRGLILYRESTEKVAAFERHCTFDPSEVCSTVDMDGSGLLQANDYDCCGSIFGINTRAIIQGPASRPLLEYMSQFDGTFVTVTN